MSITAYWISPLGEHHPVPTTHINFITDNPNIFGLTSADIQSEYAKQDEDINVSEGTGAMRGYTELLFGDGRQKANYETALLRYCKLDTLAMVIIWAHWESIR